MSFDTELIAAVRALSAVDTTCTNKKIYHEEVLQSAGFDNFPCVAYTLLSDVPFMEIGGAVSGFRQATFSFACYSKKTAETRALSLAIQSLTGTRDDTVIEWIEAEDTTDTFAPPIDLDEKGVKAAEVTVAVVYRG